jgi:hypothetical protein
VAQCLTGFESPAVPLSGGLDSRFILDLAVQGGSKATAYTWGVEGCRDLTYASSVAHKLGCSHQSYFFDPAYLAKQAERGVWLTEGQTPATNFHVLPYLDLLAENRHDLILDGFAGDAVLGGNFITPDWYQEPDVSIAAEGLWQWRRSSFDNGWNSPALDNMRSTARELFTATYMRASGRTPMDKAMAFLIDNRVRRTTVCGSELFRSRIHVRQPFMSPKFMESISHLPHTWRKRHRFYVDVMRRYAPSSAAAPYQRTMLPASAPYWQSWLALALQRTYSMAGKRLPFLPPMSGKSPSDFPAWLRGPLRPYVENVLLSERTLDRAIVPPDVTKLVVSTHMAGGSDFSALIGAMISIELFCRLFVDDLASSVRQFSECGGNISPGNGQ